MSRSSVSKWCLPFIFFVQNVVIIYLPHAYYIPRPSQRLDFVIIIFGEEYNSWSLSWSNFFHPSVTFNVSTYKHSSHHFVLEHPVDVTSTPSIHCIILPFRCEDWHAENSCHDFGLAFNILLTIKGLEIGVPCFSYVRFCYKNHNRLWSHSLSALSASLSEQCTTKKRKKKLCLRNIFVRRLSFQFIFDVPLLRIPNQSPTYIIHYFNI
jgi:hypothetical protein